MMSIPADDLTEIQVVLESRAKGSTVDALEKIHDIMHCRKKDLDCLLRLTEQNSWRRIIYQSEWKSSLDTQAGEPRTDLNDVQRFLHTILGAKYVSFSFDSLTATDSNGRNTKLTRAVRKEINRKGPLADPEQFAFIRNAFFTTGVAKIFAVNSLLSDKELHKFITNDFIKWIGNLASRDSSTSGAHITISTNLADFVLASHEMGFTSCYSPAGEYFSGTSCYAIDSQTVIVKYARAQRYIGRVWVHIDLERALILQSCVYGHIPVTAQKEAHSAIERELTSYHCLSEDRWMHASVKSHLYISGHTESNFGDDYTFAGFLDVVNKSETCKLLYPVEKYKDALDQDFILETFPPVCFLCGCVHGESKGYCSSCARNICFLCGAVLEEGILTTPDNDIICASCYERHYFTCLYCANIYKIDDAVEVICDVNGGYEYWCPDCVANHAVECIECGNTYSERAALSEELCVHCGTSCGSCNNVVVSNNLKTVQISTGYSLWCHNCVRDYATICNICGCLVDKSYMDNTGRFCLDCHVEEEMNVSL